MVLGISAVDRPGLLHDISQGLDRLQVQLLHCEVRVQVSMRPTRNVNCDSWTRCSRPWCITGSVIRTTCSCSPCGRKMSCMIYIWKYIDRFALQHNTQSMFNTALISKATFKEVAVYNIADQVAV